MITKIDELVDLLKLKLADYLESMDITDPRKHFTCICGTHDDSTPSMILHKDGTYAKCFSCGVVCDIFKAASLLEDKPLSGPEFITDNVFYLADKFGIKYNISKSDDARSAMKNAYFRAYRIVADYITNVAENNPTEAFLKEIKKRKWKKKESISLGLGCVNLFSDLLNELKVNEFSKEFIELIGLMRPDIFNKDSLIFTIYDEFGRPIAFYSRDVFFEDKKEEFLKKRSDLEISAGKAPVKYNSTANFTGVYEKPLFPYGIHDCKNFHKIIAVEGHGCKHSLRLAGIDNVFALGGLELSEDTVRKMADLGVTNLVLLLDNDPKGYEKVKNIIRKFFGKISIELSVMDMSSIADDVKDPDEFLRKYSVELFNTIAEVPCLQWLITEELKCDNADPYTVLQDFTPLIAMERSPLLRQKIINFVSDITGVDRNIIGEEVNQKLSSIAERQGEYALKVMDEAREILTMSPENIDGAFSLIEQKLRKLKDKENSEELFSSNETLRSVVKLQERQESDAEEPVIKTGYADLDANVSIPYNEVFGLVMSPPNSGKSALFISMALRVLENNDNAMVVIHTIDDSRDVYINRMIAALTRIKINWIARPKFFLDEDKSKLRADAYRKITEYIRQERLVIKDITHGGSVEYFGRLLSYYRDRYSDRNIVSFCDNFHRLQLESDDGSEGRHKFRAMSALMKSYTTKYDACVFSTVEMNKQDMYSKPTNASGIAEAAALQFDANLIIYLWNEMNCERDQAMLTFDSKVLEYYREDNAYVHKTVTKPIIEALILKNKLSEYKGSLYFKFHPEMSLYDEISITEVNDIKEKIQSKQPEKKEGSKKGVIIEI
jgi:DNA primase